MRKRILQKIEKYLNIFKNKKKFIFFLTNCSNLFHYGVGFQMDLFLIQNFVLKINQIL